MKRSEFALIGLLFLLVTACFFWPVWLKGWVPFPGDLLVGNVVPWSSYSFLDYAPGGVPHKAQGVDVIRQLFPWKHFSVDLLKNGQLPLWNPHYLSGNPHLANFQSGVFYPLNLIFLLFPFNFSWTVFIFLQPFLACFFAYLFLREIKINLLGCILGAFAFAFSSFFTVWIEYGNIGHTFVWLPLILFLVEKIIKKIELKWTLLLALSLTCLVLAGYVQAAIYIFGVFILYFLFRLFVPKTKDYFSKTGAFLVILVLSLLLSAVQLLPTIEIFIHSARSTYPEDKIPGLLLPWFYPVTAFVSDFFGNPAHRNYWYPGTYIERVSYIGVLPLFFALLAMAKRRDKITAFFTIVGLLSLLFSLNLYPIRKFYELKIPVISTTVYSRLLSVFSFCMAMLAGFGVDYYLKERAKKILKPALFFLGFYVFLAVFVFVAPHFFPHSWWVANLGITRRNLVLPVIFAFVGIFLILFSSQKSLQKIFFWPILAITLFDLFFYFGRITPFSPQEFVYPKTEIIDFLKTEGGINRFWGYGLGNIDSNLSTLTGTYSVDGWEPLFIRRYGELISASDDGKIKETILRSDVVLTQGYGRQALKENHYRQRLLNLLGVKYVLQKDDGLVNDWQPDYQTFPPEIYRLIWQKGKWQVYENTTALPRIFLAGEYQVENDRQKIADLIFDPHFSLLKKIILEEPLKEDFVLDSDSPAEIKLLEYRSNRILLETKSVGNKILFLSDNYFPGWQVTIDGQAAKIFRANYSFRGLPVPAGEHKIIFSYQPDSLGWGAILSLLSLSGMIIAVIKFRK